MGNWREKEARRRVWGRGEENKTFFFFLFYLLVFIWVKYVAATTKKKKGIEESKTKNGVN